MILSEGQQVIKNGYVTTPFPHVDTTTSRRMINTLKRVHEWLLNNAKELAKETKNEWMLLLLNGMKVDNLSVSDLDTLNEYLLQDLNG